jgi:hypothetical protein
LKNRLLVVLLAALTTAACRAQKELARWLKDNANARYTHQARLIGANFIASDAINQLEITQTYLTWDSWPRPYVLDQPTIRFQDWVRQDDTSHHRLEVDLIGQLTGPRTLSAATASPR